MLQSQSLPIWESPHTPANTRGWSPRNSCGTIAGGTREPLPVPGGNGSILNSFGKTPSQRHQGRHRETSASVPLPLHINSPSAANGKDDKMKKAGAGNKMIFQLMQKARSFCHQRHTGSIKPWPPTAMHQRCRSTRCT